MKLTKTTKTVIVSILISILGLIFYINTGRDYAAIIIITTLVFLGLWNLFQLLERNEQFGKNMILAAGFGITVISWFVAGYINNEQSILQKKREIKVKFLIDAFFKLQNYDNRDKETIADGYIYNKFAENSLNEIQLLGDEEVVKLGKIFALSGGKDGFQPLLIQLRDDLRKELGVSPLPGTDYLSPYQFRIFEMFPVKDTLTSQEQIDLIIRLNEANQNIIK